MCAPYFLLRKNAGIGNDLYFFCSKTSVGYVCSFYFLLAKISCTDYVILFSSRKNAGIGNDLFFCSKTSVGVPCCRIFVSLRVVAASFG